MFNLLLVIQLFGSGQLNAHPGARGNSYSVDCVHYVLNVSSDDDQEHIAHPLTAHIDKAFEVFTENTEESGDEPIFKGKDLAGKDFTTPVFYSLPYGEEFHNSSSFIAYRRHSVPVPVCRRHVILQVFRI